MVFKRYWLHNASLIQKISWELKFTHRLWFVTSKSSPQGITFWQRRQIVGFPLCEEISMYDCHTSRLVLSSQSNFMRQLQWMNFPTGTYGGLRVPTVSLSITCQKCLTDCSSYILCYNFYCPINLIKSVCLFCCLFT